MIGVFGEFTRWTIDYLRSVLHASSWLRSWRKTYSFYKRR
jgi:hypothetical protein